jgi:drug/metabolite transporter (DMT)-like permease
VSVRNALIFIATGFVISGHWITFFLAVKVANVSICMIGVATLSLWTAILEPLIIKGRKFRPIDMLFGSVTVVGVSIIYRSELEYSNGFLIAIFSAFLAAVFTVINSFHIAKAHHYVITFYEMLGASLFASRIPSPEGWLNPNPRGFTRLALDHDFSCLLHRGRLLAIRRTS